MGFTHAQAFRFGVHHVGKARLAAAQRFGQRDGGIVARLHDQAFEQIAHRHRFARIEEHARTFGTPGGFRRRQHGFGFQTAFFQGFKGQIGRHQFGQRCRFDLLVEVFAGQNLAALQILHQISGGGDFRRGRSLRDRLGRQNVRLGSGILARHGRSGRRCSGSGSRCRDGAFVSVLVFMFATGGIGRLKGKEDGKCRHSQIFFHRTTNYGESNGVFRPEAV